MPVSPNWCRQRCSPRDPLGASSLACNDGLVCNPWRGSCVTSDMIPTTGGLVGDRCASNADCRSGFCETEVDSAGNETGYIEGICSAFAVTPSPSDYTAGAMIPQGDCPDGSAPAPIPMANLAGVLNGCFPLCTTAADCRPGYTCFRGPDPSNPTYANGTCFPLACDIPGMDCPTGYQCDTTVLPTRCVPM
jgi:hypothetical protein